MYSTESRMYFPTSPDELPIPARCFVLFELSNIRVDENAPAASTTTLAFTENCSPVLRLLKLTPVAFPQASTSTRLTTASQPTVRFPVRWACGMRTVVL